MVGRLAASRFAATAQYLAEVSSVRFIQPALPTGEGWQYELNFDGYRVQPDILLWRKATAGTRPRQYCSRTVAEQIRRAACAGSAPRRAAR
jgi:ATP-dependent DNA ligase